MFRFTALYSRNIWAQSIHGFYIHFILSATVLYFQLIWHIRTRMITHTVFWLRSKTHCSFTKRLTSSCQKPWENIPEIQPRRQSWECGVSFIRRALCWEQRREESVALSPKPTVRHLAWEWMTAGIENQQKAKDAFKLSSFMGKEASISTNKKKYFPKKRKLF